MTQEDIARVGQAILDEVKVRKFVALPRQDFRKARSYPLTREILAAAPVDDITLSTLAHEAGHLATTPQVVNRLRHQTVFAGTSVREELAAELAATKWAAKAIRRHGGTVTQAMQTDWKEALGSYTDDPIVWRYAPPHIRNATAAYLFGGKDF